jgi:hypothetical protein
MPFKNITWQKLSMNVRNRILFQSVIFVIIVIYLYSGCVINIENISDGDDFSMSILANKRTRDSVKFEVQR